MLERLNELFEIGVLSFLYFLLRFLEIKNIFVIYECLLFKRYMRFDKKNKMYILLLLCLLKCMMCCPIEIFNPVKFHFIKKEQLLCIEFDMVVRNKYHDVVILQNRHNRIRSNLVTENYVEREIDLQVQDKCWSLPMSLFGVITDPMVCMKYEYNMWPRRIVDLSVSLRVLQLRENGTTTTECSFSKGSLENIPIVNVLSKQKCGMYEKCKHCMPSCKLLVQDRGSYICDGQINHIQVPTLLPTHQTPLFSLRSHKFVSQNTLTWCIDFTFIPEMNVDGIDLHLVGYNLKGDSIDMQQACKPFDMNDTPGKLCFITNKNTELDHVKIDRMILYFPSHHLTIKSARIDLKDTHLSTRERLTPEEPCMDISCEKWLFSDQTCLSGISKKIRYHNIGKSLLFTSVFIMASLLILFIFLYLSRKKKKTML